MNDSILNSESQKFINDHLNEDLNRLILKGISQNNVTIKELVEQIESKKKAETKLPSWFHNNAMYYPNKISIEQTSSELTAAYKSGIIKGRNIIDVTGGFGVDAYHFSRLFDHVVHCEINKELSSIARYNFGQLKAHNIETLNVDGIEHLRNNAEMYDWIYVDPSRRHDEKGKVYFLGDCLPNVPEHLELLLKRSENLLIKTSPLLDISMGINELRYVKAIHIVAVNNEVKELLWILKRDCTEPVTIETINIAPQQNIMFSFDLKDEAQSEAPYSMPLAYLYEPNAAILKAGAFNVIASQLKVFKLHKHSHLYTSNELIQFPGRSFKIESVEPYNKKLFKRKNIEQANISTRNFPESVQKIRSTLKIKDGGDVYLFFTTDSDGQKVAISCSKIN